MLEDLRSQAAALWAAINQRGILLPALFVFLWQVRAPGMHFFKTLSIKTLFVVP